MADQDNEKLKLIIDLVKWFITSVVIVVVTLIIDSSFRARTAGLEEMEAFDGYVETILKANNIEERWKLSEFFSTVTPTERLRVRWVEYRQAITADYEEFRRLERERIRLERREDSLSAAATNAAAAQDSNAARLENAVRLKDIQRRMEQFEQRLVENEERTIVGPTVTTANLHNVRFKASSECYPIGDGKYCFKKSILTVKVPGPNWVFIGEPYVEVVEDNNGSAEWNKIGASDRFTIISDSPTEKVAEVFTGSGSIKIRLVCKARQIR